MRFLQTKRYTIVTQRQNIEFDEMTATPRACVEEFYTHESIIQNIQKHFRHFLKILFPLRVHSTINFNNHLLYFIEHTYGIT